MDSIEVRPFPDDPQLVDEIIARNAQVTVSRLSQSSLSLTVRTSDDLRVFTMFTEPPTTPLDAWGVEPPDDVIFTSDPPDPPRKCLHSPREPCPILLLDRHTLAQPHRR